MAIKEWEKQGFFEMFSIEKRNVEISSLILNRKIPEFDNFHDIGVRLILSHSNILSLYSVSSTNVTSVDSEGVQIS